MPDGQIVQGVPRVVQGEMLAVTAVLGRLSPRRQDQMTACSTSDVTNHPHHAEAAVDRHVERGGGQCHQQNPENHLDDHHAAHFFRQVCLSTFRLLVLRAYRYTISVSMGTRALRLT